MKITWVATTVALPQPGQTVHARIKNGTVVHRVKFLDEPIQRWEEPGLVYPLAYFFDWAPFTGDKSKAKDSNATVS